MKKNLFATILKVISYVFFAAGLITGIVMSTDAEDAVWLLLAIGGFILFAFVRGFAEIIQLLEDIKGQNAKKDTAPVVTADELPDL